MTAEHWGEWSVESLRATIFRQRPPHVPEHGAPDAHATWARVVGVTAHTIETRPEQDLMTFTGIYGSDQAQMLVRSDRVDWMLHPRGVSGTPDGPPLPNLSASGAAPERIFTIFDEVAPDIESPTRIAFGAVLATRTDSLAHAYEELGQYVPPFAQLNEFTELECRLNRVTSSENDSDLTLNAMSKWSVQLVSSMEIQLIPGESPVPTLRTDHVLRLELDYSTMPQVEPLADPAAVFRELVEMASRTARKGYV